MNLMQYKGYYGSIEASTSDNILFGKLQFIQPLVNYEGTTVAELKNAFEEAVEDYLKYCQDTGLTPEKPFKGSFNIRVGPQKHARIMLHVKRNDLKSLNKFINQAIDHELERQGA